MINRPSKDYIWNHYEKLKDENRQILRERKEEMYSANSRLAEIEASMTEISLSTNRSLLNTKTDPELLLQELKETHRALKEERVMILKEMGLPKNYLDPIHSCNLCEDTGFIMTTPCVCRKKLETKLRYDGSNLESVLEQENFDTFQIAYYNDIPLSTGKSPKTIMGDYLCDCMDFAAHFDTQKKNLLFFGKPGLGKTFLCHSIAKDLMDSGYSVLYITASELMDFVRNTKFGFDSGAATPEELSVLYDSELLIIDDLGTETASQFSSLVLYELLNRRLTDKKKMVISTNLEIDDLTNLYSERINSRLFGNFEFMEFVGEDIRLMKVSLL